MPISNPSTNGFFNVATLQTDAPLCFPGGRLSLSTTNPIADVSNATTLSYLPYAHGVVPFWNHPGQFWEYRPIPENGITLNRTTENPRIVDVFAQVQANQLDSFGIDLQSWNSETTRLRSLVRKRGIYMIDYVTGGAPLRTYLGSIRFIGATGAAKMHDTDSKRFVFNAYNKVAKRILLIENAASWTVSSSAWQPLNNNAANRIEVISGDGEGVIDVTLNQRAVGGSAPYAGCGIAVDNTTSPELYSFSSVGDMTLTTRLTRPISVGYHYFQPLQISTSGSPITFYGQGNSALIGMWQC